MMELEAKFRVESHEAVRRALVSLQAHFVSRVVETNYILDRPDGSLRAAGTALRIRGFKVLEGPPQPTRLTFKGPLRPGRFKVRDEYEVEISDLATTRAILEGLGFVVTLEFEKRRETWQSGDSLVELDELPVLGRFVEIEGPREEAIATLQAKLGLDELEHVAAGYVAMISGYCEEHAIADRRVTFGD